MAKTTDAKSLFFIGLAGRLEHFMQLRGPQGTPDLPGYKEALIELNQFVRPLQHFRKMLELIPIDSTQFSMTANKARGFIDDVIGFGDTDLDEGYWTGSIGNPNFIDGLRKVANDAPWVKRPKASKPKETKRVLQLDDLSLSIFDQIAGTPSVTQTTEMIHRAVGGKIRTIRYKLLKLEQRGLIHRPEGDRSGYAVTVSGSEHFNSITQG